MEPIAAVKELRAHLRESQQAFATRLGVSIRAVANYEGNRNPTGRALASLTRVAHEVGRTDLAEVFRQALSIEIGMELPSFQEQENIEALRWMKLRPNKYPADLATVEEIFEKAKRELRAGLGQVATDINNVKMIAKLASEGKTKSEVENLLGVTIEGDMEFYKRFYKGLNR